MARGYGLRNGHINSCGCLHKESARKTGKANKKYNTYDLTGEYGIGYTLKGEPFYFDLEDYDLIKDYCWAMDNYGYLYNKSGTKIILMHRLLMNAPKGKVVDHIYHCTNDNRKSQLRICSYSENAMNKAKSNSSSGITGVYWYSREEKWSAEIGINGKSIRLGLFNDKDEAIKARKMAEQKYYGDYAYKGE